MRTRRNPHCPYASGDTKKEKLTKRLCSLVDNSLESCKKVPSLYGEGGSIFSTTKPVKSTMSHEYRPIRFRLSPIISSLKNSVGSPSSR